MNETPESDSSPDEDPSGSGAEAGIGEDRTERLDPTPATGAATAPAPDPYERPRRPLTGPLIAGAAVVLALIAGLLIGHSLGGDDHDRGPGFHPAGMERPGPEGPGDRSRSGDHAGPGGWSETGPRPGEPPRSGGADRPGGGQGTAGDRCGDHGDHRDRGSDNKDDRKEKDGD